MKPAPPVLKRQRSPAAAAGPRLARVLNGLVQRLTVDLLDIPSNPHNAVHRLRGRTKKLGSLLALAAGCTQRSERDEIKAVIRRIKNAFAEMRDREVILATAEKAGVRKHLEEGKTAAPVDTAPLLAAAGALSSLMSTLPVHALAWKDIRDRCRHNEHQARQRWLKARDNPAAEHLHACRKKTKALYFQLVFLRLLKGGRKRKIKLTRRLAHHLGEHHDLHLLRLELKKRACLTAGASRKIDKHQEAELHHITRLGHKLYP